MSAEEVSVNESSPAPGILAFLTASVAADPAPPSVAPAGAKPDPTPIIIALACIFLLLATCLLFITLCKPAALIPGPCGPSECMPHHPASPSEPRLRLWKRLGSLRHPRPGFHRSQPGSRCPQSAPTWVFMESTQM
ncbi:uncharacterized protein C10orf105 homolog [Tachyglossus aculeatus]|uniref:uncharacterized protein C10orf105 homolog n=1 Tax=Tachyglossus aculeatus TaxID=9261 RepID=UPI0018F67565|nr:uncharacterized protein C10orf105 homolog [Tachyglossus aculeatus]